MEIRHFADWYRATTLEERAGHLSPATDQPRPDPLHPRSIRARKRADTWRSLPCFADDLSFARRLEADGLSVEGFSRLLEEPAESLGRRLSSPPSWLTRLATCYTWNGDRPGGPPEEPELSLDRGSILRAALALAGPLVASACDRLRESVQLLLAGSSPPPLAPAELIPSLVRSLARRLAWLSSRTIALELQVARIEERLEGATPEERFESFVDSLRDGEAGLGMLREYPVLARQMVLAVDQWQTSELELLERLADDWSELHRTFFPVEDPGRLVAADDQAGDRHNGGRSVRILRFSSGRRLVYKPKPLAIDKHFQRFLDWLNERGDHPPFRTFQVLDRGRYGWVEFVAREGCKSPDEVHRFYQRIGGMLAVLYVLEATDSHYENLVAAGEHPVLIDLESLFQARFGPAAATTPDALAQVALQHSVLRVGLLPNRVLLQGRPGTRGLDLSALGARPGEPTPIAVPHWERLGTDEMHLTRSPLPLPEAQSRPSLDQEEIETLDYAEDLVHGFESLYDLLLAHRDELLGSRGPLSRCRNDEVRVILRATQTYGQLLFESLHPDVLRDALDRDRMFDRLWVSDSPCPQFGRVFQAEHQDLRQGDIPLFTTRAGSRDLWTSRGERIPRFFGDSGVELVERRLRALGDADRERQAWFLRASLTSLATQLEGRSEPSRWSSQTRLQQQEPASGPVSGERLLEAAREVGDRLTVLAYRGESDASWVGLHLLGPQMWGLRPLALDLYGGLPGVALFLGYLGAVARDDRYTELAREALDGMLRLIETARHTMPSVGGFNGWGGVLYVLSHLAALWDRHDLADLGLDLVEGIPDLLSQDQTFDVIGGTAGCIGGLLSLQRVIPSEATLEAARRGGRRLLETATPTGPGLGWPSPFPSTGPLAGFSHGAAGIAWSLLELAHATGDTDYRKTAVEAIRYERALFCQQAGNWRDLRVHEDPSGARSNGKAGDGSEDAGSSFMTAWCHGAPGIGLARLRALRYLDDPRLDEEIRVALHTTLDQEPGASHCLCHGDLGNLDLLIEASRALGEPQWHGRATVRVAATLDNRNRRGGWSCGVPLGVETPGLMTGLAGIGYGLLRLAKPDRVPCLLRMEPPLRVVSGRA